MLKMQNVDTLKKKLILDNFSKKKVDFFNFLNFEKSTFHVFEKIHFFKKKVEFKNLHTTLFKTLYSDNNSQMILNLDKILKIY